MKPCHSCPCTVFGEFGAEDDSEVRDKRLVQLLGAFPDTGQSPRHFAYAFSCAGARF